MSARFNRSALHGLMGAPDLVIHNASGRVRGPLTAKGLRPLADGRSAGSGRAKAGRFLWPMNSSTSTSPRVSGHIFGGGALFSARNTEQLLHSSFSGRPI